LTLKISKDAGHDNKIAIVHYEVSLHHDSREGALRKAKEGKKGHKSEKGKSKKGKRKVHSHDHHHHGIPMRYYVTTNGKKDKVLQDIWSSNGECNYEFDDIEAIVVSVTKFTDLLNFKALGYDDDMMEPDPVRSVPESNGSKRVHDYGPCPVKDTGSQVTPYGLNMIFEHDIPRTHPESLKHLMCVVDGGYDSNHPDLREIVISGDGKSTSFSGCDHGTHVAGTIVALNNDIGALGIYPGAPLIIVKVFEGTNIPGECTSIPSTSSAVLAAANACYEQGARIINISIGGTTHSINEEKGYEMLRRKGVLVFAAAGNKARSGNPIVYPAYYPSVSSVAALDQHKEWAKFSTFNNHVDIAAPGVHVYSTIGRGHSYMCKDGTSMACPHASGMAFLLWNQFPSCTGEQVLHAIFSTAKDLGKAGKDSKFGHGLIQYWPAVEYLRRHCAPQ